MNLPLQVAVIPRQPPPSRSKSAERKEGKRNQIKGKKKGKKERHKPR